MIAMCSCENNGNLKEKFEKELSRLRKGFCALNNNNKKGVLKTAQGLLRIQKAQKEMVVTEQRFKL